MTSAILPEIHERGTHMGKIIAVSNQKGGVGKSTTVVNLAAALGGKGKKVLVVDIDAQGNTTTGLGVRKRSIVNTVYEVLIGACRAADAIVPTAFKGVSLISSAQKLAGAEIELASVDNRLMRLKMQLLAVKDMFDFILIDTPPSLSLITLNALVACDSVMIPIQCEFYSLEGLVQLTDTIKRIKDGYNPNMYIEGILFTMYVGRYNLTAQVVNEVNKYFAKEVYKTVIPRNVALSEAPSHGKPIMYYDRSSRGCEAYETFCSEFLSRIRQRNKK
jgi:chromosome partitioning protein